MKNFLCALCVLCGLNLFAANWPTPPAGYAYETDLRPHALVMTNATAAGLATHADVATNKATAIYTPDGETYTDATGCVWQVERAGWRVELEDGVRTNIVLRPSTGGRDRWIGVDDRQLYRSHDDGTFIYEYWRMGEFYLSAEEDARLLTADGFRIVRLGAITNLVARFATETDFATTIPQTITNVVRDVQGLVYDEKLGITWKQTMYDGNLYYIAVTNANITEVAQ